MADWDGIVERVAPDGLSKEVWRFDIAVDTSSNAVRNKLAVMGYGWYKRNSIHDEFSVRWHWQYLGNSNMRPHAVPKPADVVEEARQRFVMALRVVGPE